MKTIAARMLDQGALEHDQISVSAGQRGLQMILSPQNLQRATQAELADLAKPKAG